MTPIPEVLLSLSLAINGRWLGNSIVGRLNDNPTRIFRVTLALLVITVSLIAGAFDLHFHGPLYAVDKALCMILIVACGTCLQRLMELLPSPWGNAPKKRKAR